MKYIFFGVLSIALFLVSCSKYDPSCGNPSTTYHRNIDTANIPYKKGKSQTYIDKNNVLVTMKIVDSKLFYNYELEPISNPDCGIRDTSYYVNQLYNFDTLASVQINNKYDTYDIYFNGSSFYFYYASLINPSITYYPYYKTIKFSKIYSDVRLIINTNQDSLYINNIDGILRVINSNNTYTIK